jgi:hypothetical protein
MRSSRLFIGSTAFLFVLVSTIAATTYLTQETFSITAGGSAATSSIGRDATPQTGYGAVTVNSGSAPYATAVLSYAPNGIISSEVGIPSSPPTRSARLFVEYRTGVASGSGTVDVYTGIAVVNTGTSSATVSLVLRDMDGSDTPIASGSFQIAAGAHMSKFINQFGSTLNLPGNFPAAIGFATLEITSDQALSIAALRMTTNQRNEALYTSTPIADLSESLSTGSLDFPQVAEGGGYQTTLVFMNTSVSAETGAISFRKDDGTPMPVRMGGATITVTALSGVAVTSPCTLPGGGKLVVK